MIMPVSDEALEEIGPAQDGAVGRGGTAQDNMISAAGAGMPAIEHEFLRSQPGLPRFFVKHRGVEHQLIPGVRRVNVNLDHTRVGSDAEMLQARIVGRGIALDHNRQLQLSRAVLDGGYQLDKILRRTLRRQEHIKPAGARLHAQCRADYLGH